MCSRGSRGGYPLAALGSEDWCNPSQYVCGCVGARIAPPFMEATDASRLVCVVVVSYQEYSLTHEDLVCLSATRWSPAAGD